MKYFLLILFTAVTVTAYSQLATPVSVANAYTLTDADGFPGYNYVLPFQITSSGKIYIKDFFGNFHITGNNFIKYVPGVKDVTNGTFLIPQSDHELWLYADTKRVTIINNDSVQKTVGFPYNNYYTYNTYSIHFKQLFHFRPVGNCMEIYQFKKDNWVLLNKAPWNKNIKIEKDGPVLVKNNQIWLLTGLPGNRWGIYGFDTVHYRFKFINAIPQFKSKFYYNMYNDHWQINKQLLQSFAGFYTARTGKRVTENTFRDYNIEKYFAFGTNDSSMSFIHQNGLYEYFTFDSTHINPQTFFFEAKNKLTLIQKKPYYPYYIVLTGNKPLKVFPYIKKYPYIFNKNNSSNIFSLVQDDEGRIWAGSYQNYLSIIAPLNPPNGGKAQSTMTNDKSKKLNHEQYPSFGRVRGGLIELGRQPYPFMNAAFSYRHKIYLVGESMMGGILEYDMKGRMHQLQPHTPNGFYLYYARRNKMVFMPSAEPPDCPVYYCNISEFDKPFVHWKKLNTAAGIKPFGFTTITEDTLKRIWIGHPKKGFAVYNPATKKAITYDLHNNETPVGFISSLTDNKGTVFMGSDGKGLWYYNDYTKPATPQNIHCISHPLLNHTVRITSMTVYKNWLVLGCYNKICLLNLDSFYVKHKAVVRYLNPQEAAFTSFTEQNTMIADNANGSIWFSTGDMLYQWDIKTWLQLPQYKVNVNTFLQKDSNRMELNTGKPLQLKAGINSFDIVLEYLSPDCLPRYIRTALIRQGDSIIFSEPDYLQSRFSYKNLNSGKYTFYADVFEQDGSISHYAYAFVINKHIWQCWWFWMLCSIILLLPFILWLNELRKKAIQQKQMSQMNLITLANQFRPHFILNALNTIGADLKDNPAAETVISRLGESINLIFSHTRQKAVTHSLKNEWILVENIISIHRVMYMPELQVQYPDGEWMQQHYNMQLPMGILEVIVENALLHGLRNKKYPPYILNISTYEDGVNIYFVITDNGIGRKNAMNLSSYKKHGTGTKNLTEILSILNQYNKNKIEINYEDDIYKEEKENKGTRVTVIIPKHYYYEY